MARIIEVRLNKEEGKVTATAVVLDDKGVINFVDIGEPLPQRHDEILKKLNELSPDQGKRRTT